MDEENFEKHPIEERCLHTYWKARISGYVSAKQIFENITNENADEYNRFIHIIKNVVVDSNSPALEKGLEAVLAFVRNLHLAGKTGSLIMPGLVQKCVSSSRLQTRNIALEISLTLVEMGQSKVVLDELLKGTESKNPKISSSCVFVISKVINAFGPKVVQLDSVIKKIPILLEDRVQIVRNEAKSLVVELYKWLGPTVIATFAHLKASQLSDIESEINKIATIAPKPSRFLYSRYHKINGSPIKSGEHFDAAPTHSGMTTPIVDIDPFHMLEAVNILSQIPDSFYILTKSNKWSERKNALESLECILSAASKIEKQDFSTLCETLNYVVSKDINILVLCLGVKCIELLANGLRVAFSLYSVSCFKALATRLKEKKQNVISSIRTTMDAVFKTTTIEAVLNIVIDHLNSNNPNVKSEISLFIARNWIRASSMRIHKQNFKSIISALRDCLSHSDPTVRDSAAKALGAAYSTDEKVVNPILSSLNQQKLVKIKEYSGPKRVVCTPAVTKNSLKQTSTPLESKVQTPNTPLARTAKRKINIPRSTNKNSIKQRQLQTKRENIDSVCKEVPPDIVCNLTSTNWEVRRQGMCDLQTFLTSTENQPFDLNQITNLLSTRINDVNLHIMASSISLVKLVAQMSGSHCGKYIQSLLPPLLKNMSNPKTRIKHMVLDCMNHLGNTCGYTEFFQSDILLNTLKSGPPATRSTLWTWLADRLFIMPQSNCINETTLSKYLPVLFISLEDRNSCVRQKSSDAIKGFVKQLGLDSVQSACTQFFGNSNGAAKKLVFHKCDIFKCEDVIESPHTASTDNIKDGEKGVPSNLFNGIRPLISHTVQDEKQHKLLIDRPTPDSTTRTQSVQLLKSIMTAAEFDSSLMESMFHDDVNQQLKAINLLTEKVKLNSLVIVRDLDLILRWLIIQFFDKNSEVLSKVFNFIIMVFNILREMKYCLLDNVAEAFVPYLILRLNDENDQVLEKNKEVLMLLVSVYPVNKLIQFILEGTKTKYLRQKVNCLELMKYFIDTYEKSAYEQDFLTIVSEAVKFMNDKNTDVNNSAFALITSLFEHEGEPLLKLIETQTENHFIVKKIRNYIAVGEGSLDVVPPRNNKTNLEMAANVPNQNKTQTLVSIENVIKESSQNDTVDNIKRSDHFKLDERVLMEVDKYTNLCVKPPTLIKVELDFLEAGAGLYETYQFSNEKNSNIYMIDWTTIAHCLNAIDTEDITKSVIAFRKLENRLNLQDCQELPKIADELTGKIVNILRILCGDSDSMLEYYGTILSVLFSLCDNRKCIVCVSEVNLLNLIEQLLYLITENKFVEKGDLHKNAVNTIILKVLENASKTDLLCCLIKLLRISKRTYEGNEKRGESRLNELTMKCLWKLNRSQPLWDHELDYTRILLSISHFVMGHPCFKESKNDPAVRTIKTWLRSMHKLRGENAFIDAEKNTYLLKNTEFNEYLRTFSKKQQDYEPIERKNISCRQPSQSLLSITSKEALELSEIFKEISINPNSSIKLLLDFKKNHPHIEFLLSFLTENSPSLSTYLYNVGNDPMETDCPRLWNNHTESQKADTFSQVARQMWQRLLELKNQNVVSK